MVKCINGEKATYNTQVFSTKRERTYQVQRQGRRKNLGKWRRGGVLGAQKEIG